MTLLNPEPDGGYPETILNRVFCVHCESAGDCVEAYRRKRCPRILAPVRLTLGYLAEQERGMPHYPWSGDHRCQPAWFIDLLNAARIAVQEARKDLQQQYAPFPETSGTVKRKDPSWKR